MFDINKKKKKDKTQKSFSSESKKMAKTIKNQYINNLKNKHKKTQEQNINAPQAKQEQLSNYDETTSFLNRLAERRRKKQTKKKCVPHTAPIKIKTEILTRDESVLPIVTIKPDPPYGVLKNGRKKTYRQYYNKPNPLTCKPEPVHKPEHNNPEDKPTLKPEDKPSSPLPQLPPTPMVLKPMKQEEQQEILSRRERLERYKLQNAKPKKCNYTIKRNQFSLGLKNNELSFLKKNNECKTNYEELINKIDQTPISQKKLFLFNNHFIKRGSEVPDVLVCQMYKDAMLCGKIDNVIVNNLKITVQ